ncbi:MAG TPA: acyltransferase family protein [Syntrophorhabdaceae bacterium]|nr:acyltransferase family protein [Syntrophorhabdaceae bacterium]
MEESSRLEINAARIYWLDNLKAIGVFLVVLSHMNLNPYVFQYIHSFTLPIFFFVSGCLFNRKKYTFKTFFIKSFRTILAPYLFFSGLSFIIWFFLVRSLSHTGAALAIDPFKAFLGIFYAVGSGPWRNPLNVALWFFPCLFVVELLYFLMKDRWYLLPFLAIIGYTIGQLPFRLPLSADAAITGLVFYGMGRLHRVSWLSYKYIPVFLLLHLTFCFLNGQTDMNNLLYGNIVYYYASAFAGIFLYASLCRLLKPNVIVNYVGRNTFIIIGMQGIVIYALHSIHHLFFGTKITQDTFAAGLIFVSLIIASSIPAIYLINTYLPFLLGRPKQQHAPSKLVTSTTWARQTPRN